MVDDGFTYPTLPITEHVSNDVKLSTAVSHFFCVFFKTVLQITAKRAMCLKVSITKQFMLAQKLRWTGFAPMLFCLRQTCLLLRCLNFMQHRSTNNIVQFPFETNSNVILVKHQDPLIKHCMYVRTNRTQIHIRHLKCSNI